MVVLGVAMLIGALWLLGTLGESAVPAFEDEARD